jgi:hypothetical protein
MAGNMMVCAPQSITRLISDALSQFMRTTARDGAVGARRVDRLQLREHVLNVVRAVLGFYRPPVEAAMPKFFRHCGTGGSEPAVDGEFAVRKKFFLSRLIGAGMAASGKLLASESMPLQMAEV